MVRQTAIIFVLTGLLAGLGCGDEPVAAPPKSSDLTGYREWPVRAEVVESQAGHGAVSKIYANAIVHNYLTKLAPGGVTDGVSLVRYPKGSIIVKDVLNADDSLRYVAVMRKPESPPEGPEAHGGWVWSKRQAPDGADAFQTEAACLTCHNNANDTYFRDYVFVFPDCHHTVTCK